MNTQSFIILDPFKAESDTTGCITGNQKKLCHSTVKDKFYNTCSQMIGKLGDVELSYSATRHCAIPNKSDHNHNIVLIQNLHKWVKPMEDMPTALPQSLTNAASQDIRQLLGLNFYLEVLDTNKSDNTIGRT